MSEQVGDLIPEKEQLEQFAEAFYSLAQQFQQLPCQKEWLSDEELEALLRVVQQQVCGSCPGRTGCWEDNFYASSRMFYEYYSAIAKSEEGPQSEAEYLSETGRQSETEYLSGKGQQSEAEYLSGKGRKSETEYLSGKCQKSGELSAALREGHRQARYRLMWNNRLMEQRMAVGEQIFQTAELLKRTAESFQNDPGQEQKLLKKLQHELRFIKVEVGAVRVFAGENGQREIYLALRGNRKACVSARSIAEILSKCSHEKMRPAWNCRAAVEERMTFFHFVPDTRFQIFCGISRIKKNGEMVSGDNYAFLQKDTGRVIMSLADGMGTGVRACRESEKVIELLEQFLEAGFPQETAVRMINSCLLLQNCDQMFSTIDLCMIDLYNARCDMMKSGAASTFLMRGNEIEVIDGTSIPAGIMQQADYECIQRQLVSGDTIIMMTDGVLDALPEENREQKMAELIGKTASLNAKEYARRLMEQVYLMQKLQAKDDMTILVGRIWEKQKR